MFARSAAAQQPNQCRTCGAIIRFIRLESGKPMPCDPIPDPGGNVCATPTADGRAFVNGFVVARNRPVLPGTVVFMAHWASCGGRDPAPRVVREPEPTLF